MTGVHLNLRLGGASREGAAFGGPQVYGDQRGTSGRDCRTTSTGSSSSWHDACSRAWMPPHRSAPCSNAHRCKRDRAAGTAWRVSGVPIADLDAGHKAQARTLVERIVATYATDDVAYALACIKANGGVDGMSSATTLAARTAWFRKHRSRWKARARCPISVATRTCTPSSTSRWTETRRSHPVSTSPTTRVARCGRSEGAVRGGDADRNRR